MNIPVPDNTSEMLSMRLKPLACFPDKAGCFGEIFRVLKPGGYFGAYGGTISYLFLLSWFICLNISPFFLVKWVMTDLYDTTNPKHVEIKEGMKRVTVLPELAILARGRGCVQGSGLELVDSKDLATFRRQEAPWFLSLSGSLSITGFKHTRWGRWCTHKMVSVLEWAHIARREPAEVSKILMDTADQLVLGGEQESSLPCGSPLVVSP